MTGNCTLLFLIIENIAFSILFYTENTPIKTKVSSQHVDNFSVWVWIISAGEVKSLLFLFCGSFH